MKRIYIKYKIIIWYLFIMSPFIIQSGKDVIEKGFWHTDINGFAMMLTVIFAFFAFIHNRNNDRGIVNFQIVNHSGNYYLEISNIGSSPAWDICININSEFVDMLEDATKTSLTKCLNKKITLRQNDSKHILIGDTVDKSASIIITGYYTSKWNSHSIGEKFSINDFELGFATISPTKDNFKS